MASEVRILVDLNVIVDVVQDRRPFYEESARVLDAVVRREAEGWVAAVEAGVDYLITRNTGDFETGPVPTVQPAAFLALPKL